MLAGDAQLLVQDVLLPVSPAAVSQQASTASGQAGGEQGGSLSSDLALLSGDGLRQEVDTDAAMLVVEPGQVLVGSGAFGGAVLNEGSVSPGHSPGTNAYPSYTQASSGTLRIEIAGAATAGVDYDQVAVEGAADLDGALELRLLNGFVPTAGDVFNILTYGSRTGTFASIAGIYAGDGMAFTTRYDAAGLSLTAVALPGGIDFSFSESAKADTLAVLLTSPGAAGSVTALGWFAAGGLRLTGDVTVDVAWDVANSVAIVGVAASSTTVALAHSPSSPLLTAANGVLRVSGADVAASFTGAVVAATLPGATASGSDVRLDVNTASVAVNETVTVGSFTTALALTASLAPTLTGTLAIDLGDSILSGAMSIAYDAVDSTWRGTVGSAGTFDVAGRLRLSGLSGATVGVSTPAASFMLASTSANTFDIKGTGSVIGGTGLSITGTFTAAADGASLNGDATITADGLPRIYAAVSIWSQSGLLRISGSGVYADIYSDVDPSSLVGRFAAGSIAMTLVGTGYAARAVGTYTAATGNTSEPATLEANTTGASLSATTATTNLPVDLSFATASRISRIKVDASSAAFSAAFMTSLRAAALKLEVVALGAEVTYTTTTSNLGVTTTATTGAADLEGDLTDLNALGEALDGLGYNLNQLLHASDVLHLGRYIERYLRPALGMVAIADDTIPLGDAVPTMAGLIAYLETNWRPTTEDVGADALSVVIDGRGYGLDLQTAAVRSETVSIAAQEALLALGVSLDAAPSTTLAVRGDIRLGIGWSGSTASFRLDDFAYDISANATGLSTTGRYGALGIDVTGATAAVSLVGDVAIVSDVVTVSPTINSIAVNLPISASLAGVSVTAGYTPTIALAGTPVGGGVVSASASDFAPLAGFRSLAVADATNALLRLANGLDTTLESAALKTALPYVAGTLASGVDLGGAWQTSVLDTIDFRKPRVDRISGSAANGNGAAISLGTVAVDLNGVALTEAKNINVLTISAAGRDISSGAVASATALFTAPLIGKQVSLYTSAGALVGTYTISDVDVTGADAGYRLELAGSVTAATGLTYVVHDVRQALSTLQDWIAAVNAGTPFGSGSISYNNTTRQLTLPFVIDTTTTTDTIALDLDLGSDDLSLRTGDRATITTTVSGTATQVIDISGAVLSGTGSIVAGSDTFTTSSDIFTNAMRALPTASSDGLSYSTGKPPKWEVAVGSEIYLIESVDWPYQLNLTLPTSSTGALTSDVALRLRVGLSNFAVQTDILLSAANTYSNVGLGSIAAQLLEAMAGATWTVVDRTPGAPDLGSTYSFDAASPDLTVSVVNGKVQFQGPNSFSISKASTEAALDTATVVTATHVTTRTVVLDRAANTTASAFTLRKSTFGVSALNFSGSITTAAQNFYVAGNYGFIGIEAGGTGTGTSLAGTTTFSVALDLGGAAMLDPSAFAVDADTGLVSGLTFSRSGSGEVRIGGIEFAAGFDAGQTFGGQAQFVGFAPTLDDTTPTVVTQDLSLSPVLATLVSDGKAVAGTRVSVLPSLSDGLWWYSELAYADIAAAVSEGATAIADALSAQPFYTQNLPGLSRSIQTLTGFATEIAAGGASALTGTATTIQAAAAAVASAFGLSTSAVSMTLEGATLRIRLSLSDTFSEDYGFSLNVATLKDLAKSTSTGLDGIAALVDRSGNSDTMAFSAAITTTIDVGLSLSQPNRVSESVLTPSTAVAFATDSAVVTNAQYASLVTALAAALPSSLKDGMILQATVAGLRTSAESTTIGTSRQAALRGLADDLTTSLGIEVELIEGDLATVANLATANVLSAVTLVTPNRIIAVYEGGTKRVGESTLTPSTAVSFATGSANVEDALYDSLVTSLAAVLPGTLESGSRLQATVAGYRTAAEATGVDASRQAALRALADRLSTSLGIEVELFAGDLSTVASLASANVLSDVTLLRPNGAAAGTTTTLDMSLRGTGLKMKFFAGGIHMHTDTGYLVIDGDGLTSTTSDKASLTVAINSSTGNSYNPAVDTLATSTSATVSGKLSANLPLILELSGSADTGAGTLIAATPTNTLGTFFSEMAGATITGNALTLTVPDVTGTFATMGGDTSIMSVIKDVQEFKDSLKYSLDAVYEALYATVPQELYMLEGTATKSVEWFSQLSERLATAIANVTSEGDIVLAFRNAIYGAFAPTAGTWAVLQDTYTSTGTASSSSTVDANDVYVSWRKEDGTLLQQWAPGTTTDPALADALQFNLKLKGTFYITDSGMSLKLNAGDFKIDIPLGAYEEKNGIPLKDADGHAVDKSTWTNGGFAVQVEWAYNMGFGISKTSGFYLATAPVTQSGGVNVYAPEITSKLTAYLDGSPADPAAASTYKAFGPMNIFQAYVEDSKPKGATTASNVTMNVKLDLVGGAKNRLTLDDLFSVTQASIYDAVEAVEAPYLLNGITSKANGTQTTSFITSFVDAQIDIDLDATLKLYMGKAPNGNWYEPVSATTNISIFWGFQQGVNYKIPTVDLTDFTVDAGAIADFLVAFTAPITIVLAPVYAAIYPFLLPIPALSILTGTPEPCVGDIINILLYIQGKELIPMAYLKAVNYAYQICAELTKMALDPNEKYNLGSLKDIANPAGHEVVYGVPDIKEGVRGMQTMGSLKLGAAAAGTKLATGLQFTYLLSIDAWYDMMVGNATDLVTLDLPQIGYPYVNPENPYDIKTLDMDPILLAQLNYGVLNFKIEAVVKLALAIDISFGFDTSGIQKAMETGNPAWFLDGFYVGDYTVDQLSGSGAIVRNTGGKEKPEAYVKLGVGLQASAGVGLISGGFEGLIEFGGNFDLHDIATPKLFFDGLGRTIGAEPETFAGGNTVGNLNLYYNSGSNDYDEEQDGKLHPSEMWALLSYTGPGAAGPFNLFDLYITVDFVVNLFVKAENPFTGKDMTIAELEILRINLLNIPFWTAPDMQPTLGYVGTNAYGVSNGILTLNAGSRAGQRERLDKDDDGETWEIFTPKDNSDLTTVVLNKTWIWTYRDITRIVVDLGKGDDYFDAQRLSSDVAVSITGGSGDDTIMAGVGRSGGYYFIDGGDGGDRIDASLATIATTLIGGIGNDTIYGGSAADTIEAGAGSDKIIAAGGADTISSGTGDDRISGGDGADTFVLGDSFGATLITDRVGLSTLNFSSMTNALGVKVSGLGLSASSQRTDGTIDVLRAPGLLVSQIGFGTGNDTLRASVFPSRSITVTDVGGNDDYYFLLGTAASAATAGSFGITDSQGSFDEVQVEQRRSVDVIRLGSGSVVNGRESISYNNLVERLTLLGKTALYSATDITSFGTNVTFRALTDAGTIDLGTTGLRVIANSVSQGAEVIAAHVIIQTLATIEVNYDITALSDGYIDFATFGDDADVPDIALNADLYVSSTSSKGGAGSGWVRLQTARGSITSTATSSINASGSHLTMAAFGDIGSSSVKMTTDVASASIFTAADGTGSVFVSEADSLTLRSDATLTTVENGGFVIGSATLQGHWESAVTWAASVTQAWKNILSNNYVLSGAVMVAGGLTTSLRGNNALLLANDTVTAGDDILLEADDLDLHAGARSLLGTDTLTIRTMHTTQAYAIGTAAEALSGTEVLAEVTDRDDYLELSSRDLTAIGTGFSTLIVGRSATAGTMYLGDVKDSTLSKMSSTVRASGSNIAASDLAAFRNTTRLLADTIQVQGDVQAPADSLTLEARILQVNTKNWHDPNGTPDSGASADTLVMQVSEQAVVSGWLKGSSALTVNVTASTGVNALESPDYGALSLAVDTTGLLEAVAAGAALNVTVSDAVEIRGIMKLGGANGSLVLKAGGPVIVDRGGTVYARGANTSITLESTGDVLAVASGGAISGGIAYTTVGSDQIPGVTGANASISLISAKAMRVDGAIVASDSLTVSAGDGVRADASYGAVANLDLHPAYGIFNQAGYFSQLATVMSTHYLANYSEGYGLLVTGTLSVLADNSTIDLHAEKAVILRANVSTPGASSEIVLRSAGLMFVEGYLNATKGITISGGYTAGGVAVSSGGYDANGTSVAFGPASRLWTTESGSKILVKGRGDVVVDADMLAGGTVGVSGATWTGSGADIEIIAGERIDVESVLQASGDISIAAGDDGSDDSGMALVTGIASSIAAAGRGYGATGSTVTLAADGAIEIAGRVVSGATRQLVAGEATTVWTTGWGGTSSISVDGEDVVVLGGTTTVNLAEVEVGATLEAADTITVTSGANSAGIGVHVYAATVAVANNADGTIVIGAGGDAYISGVLVAGGTVTNELDASGDYLGRSFTYGDGDSSISISSGAQVRLAQSLTAGASIAITGGVDPLVGSDSYTGNAILLEGSVRLQTTQDNSSISLESQGAIRVFAPAATYELTGTGWPVTADGRLTSDATLRIAIDHGNYTAQADVVVSVSNTATNTSTADLVADLNTALRTAAWTISATNGRPTDPVLGAVHPFGTQTLELEAALLEGHIKLRGPYSFSILSGSTNESLLGFDATPMIEAAEAFAINAQGDNSSVKIDSTLLSASTSQSRLVHISGMIGAEAKIEIEAGEEGLLLAAAGALDVRAGSLSVDAGAQGAISGRLSAAGAGNDVTITGTGQLTLNGEVSANNNITIDVAQGSGTGLTIAATADLHTTSGGTISIEADGNIALNSSIGEDSTGLTAITVTSTAGAVTLDTTTGRIVTDGAVAIAGVDVTLNGVVTTTAIGAANAPALAVEATTGDLAIYGTVTASSGTMDVSAGDMLTIAGGMVTANTIEADANVIRIGTSSLSGIVLATSSVDLSATDELTVAAGGVVLSSGTGSSITLDAGMMAIRGDVNAGATLTSGNVVTAGTDATLTINGSGLTIGLTDAGADLTPGAAIRATGTITIDLSAGSGDITMGDTSEIAIIQDGSSLAGAITIEGGADITLRGTIQTEGSLGSLTVDAAGLLDVGAVIDAGASITLGGGADADGAGLTVRALTLQTNAAGQNIDVAGNAVNADGLIVNSAGVLMLDANGAVQEGGLLTRVSGASLNVGSAGTIALAATGTLTINGEIGPIYRENGVVKVRPASVDIDGAAEVVIAGNVYARSTITVSGTDVTLSADTSLRARDSVGTVAIDASGLVTLAADSYLAAPGGISIAGNTLDLAGVVDSGGRLLTNSGGNTTVTGSLDADGAIDARAGVDLSLSDAVLQGTLTTTDLSGGNIIIEEGGALSASGALTLLAGGSVTVDSGVVNAGNHLRTAYSLTPQSQVVSVVTGTSLVASGTVTQQQTVWETTVVTEQIGTESVKIGSEYYTMNVTLTQTGYWNGRIFREFFVQGTDYNNVSGTNTVAWSAYNLAAPAAKATFGQLTDAQRSAVLDTLGYKPLYQFTYSNYTLQRTVDGVTTSTAAVPTWSGAVQRTIASPLPGWEGIYIKLPDGASDDLLRVISQGETARAQETVGRYQDSAKVKYTQDKTTLVDYVTNKRTIHNAAASAVVDDQDNSPARWTVSYVSGGTRTYEVYDGREGTSAVAQTATPLWTVEANNSTSKTDTGTGRNVIATQTYLDTTLSTTGQTSAGTTYVGQAGYDPHATSVDTSAYGDWQYQWGNWDKVGGDRDEWSWSRDWYVGNRHWQSMRESDRKGTAGSYNYYVKESKRYQDWNTSDRWDAGWVAETMQHYNYNWKSTWNTITDTRLTMNFAAVTKPTDVMADRPVYATFERQNATVQSYESTAYTQQTTTSDRTVTRLLRVSDDSSVAFGAFSGTAISGQSVTIGAGADVSVYGTVEATAGTLAITAGDDIGVTGKLPDGTTAADTDAAISSLTATSTITLTAGDAATLGASSSVSVTGVAGTVAVTADGAIELGGTVATGGGAVALLAGQGADGAGSVTGTVGTSISAGAVSLTAGGTLGDIDTNGARITAAGTLTLTAAAGSVSAEGDAVSATSLSATAANDLTVTIDAASASATVTGSGAITLTARDAINVVTAESASGAVSIETMDSTTALALGSIKGTTVTLTAAGTLSQNDGGLVTGTDLVVLAAGGIDLDTKVASIDLLAAASGAITVNNTRSAGLTVTRAAATDGDITISNTGSIAVRLVSAGTEDSDVSLTSTTGAIAVTGTETSTVTGASVTLAAATGITGLVLATDEVTATTTGGNISLSIDPPTGTTSVTLHDATSGAGNVTVTTNESLTVEHASAGGSSGALVLTASGDLLIADGSGSGVSGGYSLALDAGGTLLIEGTADAANTVTFTSGNAFILPTSASYQALNMVIDSDANVVIDETVTMGGSSFEVRSGGNITINAPIVNGSGQAISALTLATSAAVGQTVQTRDADTGDVIYVGTSGATYRKDATGFYQIKRNGLYIHRGIEFDGSGGSTAGTFLTNSAEAAGSDTSGIAIYTSTGTLISDSTRRSRIVIGGLQRDYVSSTALADNATVATHTEYSSIVTLDAGSLVPASVDISALGADGQVYLTATGSLDLDKVGITATGAAVIDAGGTVTNALNGTANLALKTLSVGSLTVSAGSKIDLRGALTDSASDVSLNLSSAGNVKFRDTSATAARTVALDVDMKSGVLYVSTRGTLAVGSAVMDNDVANNSATLQGVAGVTIDLVDAGYNNGVVEVLTSAYLYEASPDDVSVDVRSYSFTAQSLNDDSHLNGLEFYSKTAPVASGSVDKVVTVQAGGSIFGNYAGIVDVTALGDLTIGSDLSAGVSITIVASGTVYISDNLSAYDLLTITATNIVFTSGGISTNGYSSSLTSTVGDITMSNGTSIDVGAATLTVHAADDATLSDLTGGTITITTGGDVSTLLGSTISAAILSIDAGGAVGSVAQALVVDAETISSITSHGNVTLDLTGAVSIGTVTTYGGSLVVDADDGVTLTSTVTVGSADIDAAGGSFEMDGGSSVTAGSGAVTLSAAGDMTLADVTGGTVSLTSAGVIARQSSSSDISASTSLAIDAGGDVGTSAAPLEVATPSIVSADVTGDMTLSITGATTMAALAVDGAMTVESTAGVTLSGTNAVGSADITTNSGNVTMTALSTLNAGGGTVSIDANGAASLHAVTGGSVDVTARSGAISSVGSGLAINATTLTLDADTSVGALGNALRVSAGAITSVDAGGAARLDVTGSTIIGRVTATGIIDVDATGTISMTGALSGVGITIDSTGGGVTMGSGSTINAGAGDVTLQATGNVTVATVTGDDVVLNSSGGSLLSSPSGAANVSANTLNGSVSGSVGSGTSAPIVVAVNSIGSLTAGGLLAVESTTAISIGTLSGVGAVSLEAGAAVTLTGSISGEGLAITTTGAGSAGDFTMTSSASLDAGDSQAEIIVSGNTTIATLASTADVTLDAGGNIIAIGSNSLISGSVLYISADGSIGSNSKAVAIEAPVISAFSAGSDIDATFTGATTLQGGDAGGSIDVSADAALAITDMVQSTGAQNISAASVAFVVGATTGSLQLNGAAAVSVTATAGDVTMDDGATLISTSGNIGVDASGS
ncbi:hypothetical protein, partial [Falsiroseomonas stagni]